MLSRTTFVVTLFVVLLSSSFSNAQHFRLDSTFLYNGIDTINATGYAHRPRYVLPQLDGKILLAGNNTSTALDLIRFNYDGSIDSTFNGTGVVLNNESYVQSVIMSAMVYDTAKIFLTSYWLDAGTGWEYIEATNYNADGTLNTGFGAGGIAHVALSGAPVFSTPTYAAVQPDGKFVILGNTSIGGGLEQFALTRLNADGTVDPTYGGGIVRDSFPLLDTPYFYGSARAGGVNSGYMQASGKMVAMGFFVHDVAVYPGYEAFAVRYNTDASRDTTFGDYGGGVAVVADSTAGFFNVNGGADSMGNLYLFEQFEKVHAPFSDSNYAIIKLDSNGHLVTSYGLNGITYLHLTYNTLAFTVQKNGCVVIATAVRVDTPSFSDYVTTYRLDSLGFPDTSFAPGGYIMTKRASSNNDLGVATAIEADGKIVTAGFDSVASTAICIRYTNGPFVDTATDTATKANVLQAALSDYICPNPVVNNEFYIHYTNSGAPMPCSLTLYDAAGKVECRSKAMFSTGTGDVAYKLPPSAAPGIYTLLLVGGTGQKQTYTVAVY